MNPAFDPTAALVSRPRLPMTPEQLEAYRPKAVVAEQPAETARQIAYRAGVGALEGIVLRIEALEAEVRRLKNQ